MKKLLGSILKLGAGEIVAKLAGFAFYGYISRAFGVELLGIVALSQTVAMYVTVGTDLGLRMIGARVVARDARAASTVIPHLLRKRLISCAVCVALASGYALWGPVPGVARLYVLGFALAVIPYAFSLDWLAWGLDHFGWLASWRAGVSVLFALGAISAMHLTGATLLPITLANAASAVMGALLLWTLWFSRWKPRLAQSGPSSEGIEDHLRWVAVLPLGISTILNLMFNNFDTVMLGAMTSAAEVGRYNAAYKILFSLFGAYYLLTQSLYPKLSRAQGGPRTRRIFSYSLLGVAVLGGCLALLIAVFAAPILRFIYGRDLNAVNLLRLLSLAIPMDFCAALMGTALVSRGFDKPVLWGALTAALCDILVNLRLIPRLGCMGAAWATILSYLVLLFIQGMTCIMKPLFIENSDASKTSDLAGVPA